MRKRRHLPPTTPPSQPPPEPRPQPIGYDWSRYGRHRLRAPASVVIDVPVPADAASHVWVASVWPDSRAPGGWGRMLWDLDLRTGRGWVLPQQLAGGDVLEFGAGNHIGQRRWYGVLDSYEFDRWLTVQGPYSNAAAAYDDAQRLIAHERFLPALEADPRQVAEPVHAEGSTSTPAPTPVVAHPGVRQARTPDNSQMITGAVCTGFLPVRECCRE